MAVGVRIRPGLVERLRVAHGLPSEEVQARMMGVDRSTLRRVAAGAQPSGAFMAQFCQTFGLGLGEAFEISERRPRRVAA